MLLHRLKMLAAPLAWAVLRRTVTVVARPGANPLPVGPVIFACLHQDILPIIQFVRSRRPVLLVSTSTDGEILIRALGRSDYGFVRGQTGSEGARAVVELRRLLEDGRSIGLAVDGPKGPYGSIQSGVLQLARLTGASILPLRAVPTSALVLSTWDRTVVPWPFSRVEVAIGPEVRLASGSSDAEMADVRLLLGEFFAAGKVNDESR